AHPGQRRPHHALEELVHPVAPQRHHGADRRPIAQLEVGDGLLGPGHRRLLAADRRELLDGSVEELRVLRRLAEPHVEDDLLEPRHGERVAVAELAHERRDDLLCVPLTQSRRHAVHTLSISSPQRRQTRAARPSSRRRRPTRAGLLQRPQMGSTFERWIEASFSTIPPGLWAPRGTVPRMPGPIGSRALSMSTAELVSKRMYEPSVRPTSFAVRTMTAFMTSPFFTLAFGIASLTETTMMSPIEAYLRRVPPSTLMQRTFRAPLLSATSSTLSAWIMTYPSLPPAAGTSPPTSGSPAPSRRPRM